MNRLYYENREVASAFDFSDEVLRRALLNIYSKDFHPATEIERNLFDEIWHTMDRAVGKGIREVPSGNPDKDFLRTLKHGNAVFSAFKVHRMQNDMARLLLDSNGSLKPFERWSEEVMPIASHQVGSWLHTEYDTAVIRAHQAADWIQFYREKDILPNLEWMPSTSVNPGEDHRIFWGMIRPVEDKCWEEHRPGDRWNCKCSLKSTDKKPTAIPETEAFPVNAPQPGLRGNPGKSGQIFSDDHPYFPKDCYSCPFGKGFSDSIMRFFGARRKKDCYKCRTLDKRLKKLTDPVYLAKKDYFDLKHDPDYRDVRIDKKSGGVRATHVGHNDDTGRKEFFGGKFSGADLERECVEQLFRAGHKVVLCDESKEIVPGEKAAALDMRLDGRMMDIRSITGKGWYWRAMLKKNEQLKRYNKRPDIDIPAQALCLYFHKASMFNEENLLLSINRYKYFYDTHGNHITPIIKRIYVVINGQKEILQYDV